MRRRRRHRRCWLGMALMRLVSATAVALACMQVAMEFAVKGGAGRAGWGGTQTGAAKGTQIECEAV